MSKKILSAICLLLPMSLSAKELPTTVVTATRTAQDAAQVGSSIDVLTSEDLVNYPNSGIVDALATLPSVAISRSGGVGTLQQIRLRGSDTGQVLILLDGVRLNDPSDTSGGFNFSNISLNTIDRIEVLRGAQSALYGGDAMGGVIQLFSKKGQINTAPSVQLRSEAGSYSTFSQQASVSGGTKIVDYRLSESSLTTRGVSATKDNPDADGSTQKNIQAAFGIKASDTTKISLQAGKDWQNYDYDNSPGIYSTPDLGNYGADRRNNANVGLDYTPSKDLSVTAHVYGNTIERRSFEPTSRVALYNGTRTGLDAQTRYAITPQHAVLAGVEARKESFRGAESYYDTEKSTWVSSLDKGNANTKSVFGQYLFSSTDKKLNLTLGTRLDNHSVASNFATYRATAAYTLPEQFGQLHSSFGTGAKAPSLYQLLAVKYGNKNLQPEKSTSADAGWRFHTLNKHVQHDVTLFRNDYKQLITYNGLTSRYQNVARARTQGVEFTTDADITSAWRTRLMYTYTQANDLDKGTQLLRRPKHIAAWQNDWQLGNWSPRVEMRYNGAQPDYANVSQKSYMVVGAGLRYNLKELLGHEAQWFARVDNVLNKEYGEVTGYNAPRLSAFSGVELKF